MPFMHLVIKTAQMATAKPQLPGRLNEIKSDPADQEVRNSEFRRRLRFSMLQLFLCWVNLLNISIISKCVNYVAGLGNPI